MPCVQKSELLHLKAGCAGPGSLAAGLSVYDVLRLGFHGSIDLIARPAEMTK